MFFKGRSVNNSVTVNGSTFSGNFALWGGGLLVEHQDNSTNNHFNVYNSLFEQNRVLYNLPNGTGGTGGGGVRIGYVFFDTSHVKYNGIVFDNCTFSNNTAFFGGGLSFYASREQNSPNATNTLELVNCDWFGNRARSGAAIDLSEWHPIATGTLLQVKFRNIRISHHNRTSNLQTSGSLVGLGAMYTDGIPMQFSGYMNFHQNDQTALGAVGAEIDVLGDCFTNFTHNHGRNGGAIALFGSAFIRTYNGTHMNFARNSAKLRGGAIFSQSVGEHNLLSSQNCFIRYSDLYATPDKWRAYFNFTDNTAGDNGDTNSIYTTTVIPCLWGGVFGPASVSSEKVFCWSDRWYYSSNCMKEIQSDPAGFTKPFYTMDMFPGQRKELPIKTMDDLKNDATNRTVFIAKSVDTSVAVLDGSSRYISDNAITLYGIPNNSTKLKLFTLDPRVLFITINVTLNPCPPGFTSNTFPPTNNTKCACIGGFSYNRFVQCSRESFDATLQVQGRWIGFCGDACEDENLLVAGYSFYTYTLHDDQLRLPHHASNLSKQLCGPSKRNGTVCGTCIKGYVPTFNSAEFKCKRCSSVDVKYHWIYFILTEIVPQTVLFAILILFNISLTSGPANAFLLFAQVTTTSFGLYITNIPPYKTIGIPLNIIYGIWNLDFLEPVLPAYCLSQDIRTATLLSLNYLVALYPLFLVGLFFLSSQLFYHGERYRAVYCLCRPIVLAYSKLHRKYGRRQIGSVDALAAFLLLSYTKFTRVSIQLLSPARLYDVHGAHRATVMFYDGTIGLFTPSHVPYILSAIVVLAVFVVPPPLLLVLYPIKRFRKFMRCVICMREEEDRRFVTQLKLFLDSFYGCYKDGRVENKKKTRDVRSFAGLYFLCRIAFSVLISSTTTWIAEYSLQQLICTGVVLLILITRPYKNELFNYVDGTIFSILGAINALSNYNYFRDTYEQIGPSPIVFIFQLVLWCLPLIYMIGYPIGLYCFWKKREYKSTQLNRVATEGEDVHISDNSIMHLVDDRAQELLNNEQNTARVNSVGSGTSTSSRHGSSSNRLRTPLTPFVTQYGSMSSTHLATANEGHQRSECKGEQ